MDHSLYRYNNFHLQNQLEMQRRGWGVEKTLLEAQIRDLEGEVVSETYLC